MTSEQTSRAQPLRPTDPPQLGPYRLVGRLGEGGMGTVYLAATAAGVPLALKVIRTDLAHDPEFRRRFRGEVERAREVPPFCTAEVLDADPDHDPPYLVVEYVDGPSLAAMVDERGPLTPANLHGLAIGVATALTAIHGAGVIHRDLKPTNVLLPPGSPKVIDFGIARAVHGSSASTRNDQLIGTIAYMAPERFGQTGSAALTPAADVFAWGAVVAYAGTGRTPYGSDSPEVVAVRILTQPPDLEGLSGSLRDLVEQALAKDPTARPSARELLDRLLTAGPQRSPAMADALARQPALLRAAEEAQAATDVPLPTLAPGSTPTPPAAPTPVHEPTMVEPEPATVLTRAARPRWWVRIGVAALVLAVLGTAGTVAAIATGVLPLGARAAAPSTPVEVPPTPTPSPTRTSAGLVPPGSVVVMTDPLAAADLWERREDPEHKVTCDFDGALVVTKGSAGPYRCPGPKTLLADMSIAVDVSLLTPGSCAAVWFRFKSFAGYALRICRDSLVLMTHAKKVTKLTTFALSSPIPLRTPTRIGISAQGSDLEFYRGSEPVGTWQDATYADGTVVLGIFQEGTSAEPPYRVSFSDVSVWRAPAGGG